MSKEILSGKEKIYASRSLNFLKNYGIESVQMGGKIIRKDGKDIVLEPVKNKVKNSQGKK